MFNQNLITQNGTFKLPDLDRILRPQMWEGGNMRPVYRSQILWLSGPHTYLSVALSFSRHPVPFPTYKY